MWKQTGLLENDSQLGNKRKVGVFDLASELSPSEKKTKTTGSTWTDVLIDFGVLNGLYREKKVIFKDEELVYEGAIYKRVKLQFSSGLWPLERRIDFDKDANMKARVEEWWETLAKKTLRKKLSQKKSNTLCAIKESMRSK